MRNPTDVMVRIKRRSRRPRKGGGVPGATRELLVELSEAVGDSGPLEMGISPRRWLRAHEELNRAVQSLDDDRVEVQVADAERGLRAARRVFRLAAWSARWRKWFGGSRRALRIQVGALVLLIALVGAGGNRSATATAFIPPTS